MRQMSFFSVDARRPGVGDLGGLLCGPGQTVRFGHGGSARLSVVVADSWRARALAGECVERGIEVDLCSSDDGRPLLRTAFRADLAPLAAEWTRGAVKAVPAGLELDGPTLRLWAQTCGRPDGRGYLLGLDPHAPDTHGPLTRALERIGMAPTLLGPRGGGPALRVTGRRRLAGLLELMGAAPQGAEPDDWPQAPPAPARRTSTRRHAVPPVEGHAEQGQLGI